MTVECPNCPGVELERTHNVYASPSARTRRSECDRCKKSFTEVSFIVGEVTQHGTGAHAVAKKIGDGKLVPSLVEVPDGEVRRVQR